MQLQYVYAFFIKNSSMLRYLQIFQQKSKVWGWLVFVGSTERVQLGFSAIGTANSYPFCKLGLYLTLILVQQTLLVP